MKNERNVIQIETKNFDKQDVKMPFISLTLGQSDMVSITIKQGLGRVQGLEIEKN